MRRFLMFCALAACIAVGAADGNSPGGAAPSGEKKNAPVSEQATPGKLQFQRDSGNGSVTNNPRGGCSISLSGTDGERSVTALAELNQQSIAQHKLAFRVRGKAANGNASLTATLVVGKGQNEKVLSARPIEVRNEEFKTVVLGLDSDFGLPDAIHALQQLKFVLSRSGDSEEGTAEVEIEEVRVVSADELSATAEFIVVPFPKEKESRAVSGVTPVKVYFDFDNDDLSGYVQSRVSPGIVEDAVSTAGFRSRLLAGAEGIVELASTPEEADVLVYSRAASGDPKKILSALEGGKRLIVYGKPADPELEAKLPLALEPLELAGFAKRAKVKQTEENPLFSGQTLAGGDFGCYFKSSLRQGKAILSFEDGSPFLAQDGNILHFASGIGTALLQGDVFYDKLFLRAVALGNDSALSALEAREKEALERRNSEEAAYVKSVLDSAGIEAGTLQYRSGMSRNNMGRFGWLIGEGLSCDSIASDLTVTNGAQSYRFSTDGKLSIPFSNWSRKVLKGEIQFASSSSEEVNPCDAWKGIGEVEYTVDLFMDPAWKGKSLKFEVKSGIDDLDTVSFNGVEIGKTGKDVPEYWTAPRSYPVPESAVRWGEANRFTIRVENLTESAMFRSSPYLIVGGNSEASEIAVSSINWTGKNYRITSNGQTRELQMTLLAPFTRNTFPQSEVMLTLENTADYAAWSTPEGIRIVDLRKTPDFFNQKKDGNWKEPWLLLFREKAGNPLLLVFEKQPGSVRAQVRGSALDGIFISREEKVGIVAAGWPWGITPPETADWSKGLPEEALSQIKLGVNMALNFPVGCDEVFAIDSQNQKVEIVSAFRFSPAKDDWNTKLEPFATLPPLASFALQQKKLVATQDDVTNFNVNTRLGPTIGRSNSAAIRYSLPLPPWEDLTITGIKNPGPLGKAWNEIFAAGAQYSCGGLVPVSAWSAAKPAGNLPIRNIDLFGWNMGIGTALQGGLLLDDANRKTLEERYRIRFLEPIELYQYKNFARHRKEPFSGLEYPISFNSFYRNNTVYAPGTGSKVIYGDANEACTLAVWAGEQLADRYGHAGLIRGNWSFFKEVMRQNLFIDDYSFHASSCREFGVGAWIDMLNAEYSGMLYYARLAAIVGDKETEEQALYRAAKRTLPTLMRFFFKSYMAEAMPEIEKKVKEDLVTGFGEDGVKTMRLVNNGNFITAMDLFDFSQGSPGVLYRLYIRNVLPEIQNYLRTVLPMLTDEKHFIMRSAYLQPFSMYGEDLSALEKAANTIVERSSGYKKDWPGMCLPFHLGSTLWRKYEAPAFSECRELDIVRAEYDPENKQLSVEVKAVPQSRIVVDRAPKRVLRNGSPVEAEKIESGFSLPLAEGNNELLVEF